MNTDADTTYRFGGLSGPMAVSAAFAANAWATVPPSRGSPPGQGSPPGRGSPPARYLAGRYLAGSGLLAATPAAGAGQHATATAGEGRPS